MVFFPLNGGWGIPPQALDTCFRWGCINVERFYTQDKPVSCNGFYGVYSQCSSFTTFMQSPLMCIIINTVLSIGFSGMEIKWHCLHGDLHRELPSWRASAMESCCHGDLSFDNPDPFKQPHHTKLCYSSNIYVNVYTMVYVRIDGEF